MTLLFFYLSVSLSSMTCELNTRIFKTQVAKSAREDEKNLKRKAKQQVQNKLSYELI